jgi:hypothetical protein
MRGLCGNSEEYKTEIPPFVKTTISDTNNEMNILETIILHSGSQADAPIPGNGDVSAGTHESLMEDIAFNGSESDNMPLEPVNYGVDQGGGSHLSSMNHGRQAHSRSVTPLSIWKLFLISLLWIPLNRWKAK